MLNLLSRLALLIPFATTGDDTLEASSPRERVRTRVSIFFSLFLFSPSFHGFFTRAVSSRSTNPVLFARAILGSLILPGECQAGAASIADPVAGSRRDRKHIRSHAIFRLCSPRDPLRVLNTSFCSHTIELRMSKM